MVGLQSGKGRMMIDSVVWAQNINTSDTQTDRHFATANAMPMQRIVQQKLNRTHAFSMVKFHFILQAPSLPHFSARKPQHHQQLQHYQPCVIQSAVAEFYAVIRLFLGQVR